MFHMTQDLLPVGSPTVTATCDCAYDRRGHPNIDVLLNVTHNANTERYNILGLRSDARAKQFILPRVGDRIAC